MPAEGMVNVDIVLSRDLNVSFIFVWKPCSNLGICCLSKSVVSPHPACSLISLRSSIRTSKLFRGSKMASFLFVLFVVFFNLCCNCVSACPVFVSPQNEIEKLKRTIQALWSACVGPSTASPAFGPHSQSSRPKERGGGQTGVGRGWWRRLAESDQPPQTRSYSNYILR